MKNSVLSFRFFCVLVGAFLVSSSQLFGGYVYEFSDGGKDSKGVSTTISVESGSIKMSHSADASEETIFDSGKETMTMIDHGRKKYTQLDKKTVAAAAEKIANAMAEMEEQMASMPPAQRQMMERMMKGKMPQASGPQSEVFYKRTGEMDTIEGIKAEKVEQFTDGVKTRDLWIASWKSLEGGESIKGAFLSMSELFEEMTKAFSQGPMSGMLSSLGNRNGMNQLGELEGFPIKMVEYAESGAVKFETVLTRFEKKDFGSGAFGIPKGYKRQKMDF